MNKRIRQLQDDLISLLNGSNLPVEVKRIVLANTLGLVEKEADRAILSEIQATIESEGEDAESTR